MLEIGLFSVGLFLFTTGCLYSWVIYHSPIERTYVEVVVGVLFTLAGEAVARAIIYYHYGLLSLLWWTLPLPLISFVLTGGPMAASQEYKHRVQKKEADDTKNDRDANGTQERL